MNKLIKPKIIFMGTSDFSKSILEDLLENEYNVISVYTQGDKKVGREQEIQKSVVKILAEEKKIPVFQPKKFDDVIIEEVKKQKPDLIVVVAYGKILPKSVLEIPGFGCLNVHPSLLPKYRGPSPIQNAILNGETETGVTIMLMNEGIDTGDILAQEKISIEKNENYAELSQKLKQLSSKLLLKVIPAWIERKIESVAQNETEATYCEIIERNDGKISWADSAVDIYNRCRAFSPWPGIFTHWEKEGKILRLKLHSISLAENLPKKNIPGEVFAIDEKIFVQTGDGLIQLLEVQLEGKNKIGIADFVRGYQNFIGSILK